MSRSRRAQLVESDTSSSSESENELGTKSESKKKSYLASIRDSIRGSACQARSVNLKTLLLSGIYAAIILVLVGLLYHFGPYVLSLIFHVSKSWLSMILPTSVFKSTSAIVEEALAKYSADRLGMADYALESAGGSVLCNSDTHFVKEGAMYSIFGIPLWYHSSNPRAVIQPEVQPGQCWAMDGNKGYVTIQLARLIVPEKVSLEHIPEELDTSESGLSSAPKHFLIEGKEVDITSPPMPLGQFTYKINTGQPIQLFDLKDAACLSGKQDQYSCGPNKQTYAVINLKILSNHGNPEYTCVYRLRVHGHPLSANENEEL